MTLRRRLDALERRAGGHRDGARCFHCGGVHRSTIVALVLSADDDRVTCACCQTCAPIRTFVDTYAGGS